MRLFQFLMTVPRRTYCTSLLAVFCAFPCSLSADELPQLGETSSLYLSPKKEHEIGALIVAQIKNQGVMLDDWVITEYVQSLERRLTGQTRENLPEWFVLHDKSLNAFALPGGFIGIHSGLIEALNSEDELAAVLAHEWAHVTQHHLARLAEQSGRMNLAALAGALASIAIATQNPSAGAGALSATLGGATQSRINFTREHEAEADRVGMQILAKAGFDPRAMPDVFLHFQREERYMNRNMPEILSTHPLSASRIADASNRADKYPKKSRESDLSFLLMKVRLNLMEQSSHKKNPALATAFLDQNTTPNKAFVQTYAKAVAALLEDNASLACQTLSQIEEASIFITLAKVECEKGQQHFEKAGALLDTLLANTPYFRPAVMMKADTSLQAKKTTEAITVLQRYLRHEKGDADAYQLLAKAFNQQNDAPRMHEAEGEYRYYSGDFYGALSQFQMAQKRLKAKSIAAKRMEAKIKKTQNKIDQIRKL